jgi:hypothetical protein
MRHTDERHATLREVACERCAAVVKVTKFSPQHTSVQWDATAVTQCAEFTDRAAAVNEAAGGAAANGAAGVVRRARVRGCASLWDSIDRAVADGRLEVQSP